MSFTLIWVSIKEPVVTSPGGDTFNDTHRCERFAALAFQLRFRDTYIGIYTMYG